MTDEGMPMTCEQERSTDDAVAVLTSKLQQFKQHCSLKNQPTVFQQSIDSPGDNHAVVQIDFSENAAIRELRTRLRELITRLEGGEAFREAPTNISKSEK